jgi:hypothetical protein
MAGPAAKLLALVTVWTDGVGGNDVATPFPAAQGRTEYTGPHYDAPGVRLGFPDGDVDPAQANGFVADFHDDLVAALLDDGVPRATTQNVGDVIETAGPPAGTDHERAQCSTSRYIALCAQSVRSPGCKFNAAR